MKYKPFLKSYQKVYPASPAPQRMLLLGAGLGAALEILEQQYGYSPEATLVDTQAQILEWSQQYSPFADPSRVTWVEQDAVDFLSRTDQQYDLIGVDVFMKLRACSFIYHVDFVQKLSQISSPGAHIIINTIIPSGTDIAEYLRMLQGYFEIQDLITDGPNRYIILRKS